MGRLAVGAYLILDGQDGQRGRAAGQHEQYRDAPPPAHRPCGRRAPPHGGARRRPHRGVACDPSAMGVAGGRPHRRRGRRDPLGDEHRRRARAQPAAHLGPSRHTPSSATSFSSSPHPCWSASSRSPSSTVDDVATAPRCRRVDRARWPHRRPLPVATAS